MPRCPSVSVLGLLPGLLLLAGCVDSGAADLVLRGGKVATVDSEFSIHQAVAVKDGRILRHPRRSRGGACTVTHSARGVISALRPLR